MKTTLIILSIALIAFLFKGQPKDPSVDFNKGKWVVQYNAEFNKSNDYKWKQIPTARYHYIDLDKYPEFKKSSKIKTVPTIVLYYNGREYKRYEGNLLMQLNIPQDEIIRNIQR